jgi:hypothetical protein
VGAWQTEPMTKIGERLRRVNALTLWGLGLWAGAILLYLTVADPAAVLAIRIIGITGFALLVGGLIKRRRERPAGD